jgi:uroporphyrinogen-III synthase
VAQTILGGQNAVHPTLLLTRPRAQSQTFADQCRAAGFADDIVIAPILEITGRPLASAPAPGTMLIFTSVNGVHQASAQHDLRGFHAIAVGAATGQAARAAGLSCTVADGDAEALFALLQARHDTAPLLHLRGAHATGDLVARLRAAGQRADEAVVYDQVACALSDHALAVLAGPMPVIAPLFSPRSARLLAEAAQGATARLYPIAISVAAAAAWGGPPPAQVVPHPDAAHMLAAVLNRAVQ